MSDISLSTSIRVDEDTANTFNIRDILASAGYTTAAGLEITSFITEMPDGDVTEADTSLLGLVDSDTLYVRPGAWQTHYNGEFTTYQFIITQGNGSLVSLQLQVIVEPVNDAPSAQGRSFTLADHAAVTLSEADFGFADAVEGHGLQSVVITSLPLAGRILLAGVAIGAGAEVAIADIRAGKLAFVPDEASGGIVELGFQVRDNGGLRGSGADDTSDTAYLSFKVPVPTPPALATLGDRVWEDRDADGVQDAGEAGLAGVTVDLRDAGGNIVKTTTTDAGGHYAFEVAGGTYTVAVRAPAGYQASASAQGGDRGADSDIGADGVTAGITLAHGETIRSVDAGLYRAATIDSTVWNDADRDGLRDAGEAGVAGVTVTLLDATGTAVASAITGAAGSYAFSNLKPGTYSLAFDPATLPAGMRFVAPQGGEVGADGASARVTLGSGEQASFGIGAASERGAIAGTAWEDRNANGVREAGEAAIAGAAVHLLDASGAEVGATSTDAHGNYRFTADSGNYSVRIDAPAGYQTTAANVGSDDTVDSDVGAGGQSGAFVLPAGASIAPADAGLYRAASLSSLVWNDANDNGTRDSGEAGIEGVKVALVDVAGNTVANALTGAGGSYAFTGLKPGAYSVKFDLGTLPASLAFAAAGSDSDATGATGQVLLASGGHAALQVAAVARPGTIASAVWEDANGNGQRDIGEAAVAGATVRLLDAAGRQVASTTTDAAGNYSFSAAAGSYAVRIDAPQDYRFTAANVGANDAIDSDVDATGLSGSFVLPAGARIDPADAGVYRVASVSTQVWNDANKNGAYDLGELGIGGVKVALLDANGNTVATGYTSPGGAYDFQGLQPGSYSVKFDLSTLPPGTAYASQGSGTDATGASSEIILVSGEHAQVDMGAVTQRGTVASSVWEDSNANGVRDSGEAAVAGASVRLLDKNGVEVATATTDAAGNYSFTAAVGSYSVSVAAPSGSSFTTQNTGANDAIDSDVDAGGRSGAFEIKANTTIDPADAGIYRTASLGNRVWFDTDSDGLQDSGEAGIGGLKVFLLNGSGATVASTFTDSSGQYTFANLKPGAYSVQLDMTAASQGYALTTRNVGANDGIDSDFSAGGRSDTVTLASGENNTSLDAGVITLATIGDRVWFDSDLDGVQDAGEAGAANVVLTLANASGQTVATTTTDANGNYKFSVAAGTYSVSVRSPDGYGFTKQNLGLDTSDSDADATGKLGSVTVKGGDVVTSLDAGLVQASIGNRVWEDLDFDGLQDSGEAGIGGVTVRLYDANHILKASTVTAVDGSYSFGKLSAGSYSVEIVKPSGYYATKANAGGDTLDSDFANIGTTNVMSSGLVKLAAGEQNTNVDAGLYRKASIGDKVWRDANHNGVQDTGEEGIGKIKVALYNATTGALVGSTVTDSNGKYLFSNLDPGSYYLKFDKTNVSFTDSKNLTYAMNNWMWGVKNKVTNDAIDSDVNGDGISKENVTRTDATFLNSGENDMSWDAAITPIAIDLDGNGIHTIARADFAGKFDLLGTGNAIQSGWLSSGDAFLTIDANGNGRIDDISEMFGGAAKGSGFAKLASFDSNGDGFVDAGDAQFGALSLWRDANSDGVTDAGELFTLLDAGVSSLAVGFEELAFLDANDNLHLERSTATIHGRSVAMTDVYFNVALADALAAGIEVTTMATLVGQPPHQE